MQRKTKLEKKVPVEILEELESEGLPKFDKQKAKSESKQISLDLKELPSISTNTLNVGSLSVQNRSVKVSNVKFPYQKPTKVEVDLNNISTMAVTVKMLNNFPRLKLRTFKKFEMFYKADFLSKKSKLPNPNVTSLSIGSLDFSYAVCGVSECKFLSPKIETLKPGQLTICNQKVLFRCVYPKLRVLTPNTFDINVVTKTTKVGILTLPVTSTLKLSNIKLSVAIDNDLVSGVSLPTLTAKSLEIGYINIKTKFSVIQDFTVRDFVGLMSKLVEGEIMGVFEELFNVRGYLPRGGSEVFDKPVFVIVGENKKDWHCIVAYILSELYREIKGEKPIPTIRELGDEDCVDSTTEKFLMVNFKVWGKIEIIDARNFDPTDFKSTIRKLKGRITSSFLQGFGFFVIVTKNECINDVLRILDDVKGVEKIVIQPEYKVLTSKEGSLAIPLKDDEIEKKYKSAIFSVLGVKGDSFLVTLERRDKKLRETLKSFSPFVVKTESEREHYPLKTAVFSYLVNKEFEKISVKPKSREDFIKMLSNLLTSKIFIEKPITIANREVIPDIIYKEDNDVVYIEVESLIGTDDPVTKIQSTIFKYITDNRIAVDGKIWIVLKPISALLHYEVVLRYDTYIPEVNKEV